jgi:PAS domain S-box-containing protein
MSDFAEQSFNEPIWKHFSEPVVVCNLNGFIVYANPAFLNRSQQFDPPVSSLYELFAQPGSMPPPFETMQNIQSWLVDLELNSKQTDSFKAESVALPIFQQQTHIEAVYDGTFIHIIFRFETQIQTNQNLGVGFKFSPIAVCRLNINGTVTDMNSAFEKLTGYARSEMINQNITQVSPESWSRIDEVKFMELIQHGQIKGYEKSIVHKDGAVKQIELSATLVKNNQGDVSIIMYCNDVTSAKRKLSVIESREKHVRELFTKLSKESGTAFFEKLVVEINRAIDCDFTMVGHIDAERNEMHVIAGANRDSLLPPFVHSIENSPCRNIGSEAICLHIDDTYKKYSNDKFLTANQIRGYIGLPLLNAEGRLIGGINCLSTKPLANVPLAESLLQLVSYRIVAEMERTDMFEQIVENEIKFKTIFETSPLPIVIIDPYKAILLDVNHEFENYTGKSRQDLIGKSMTQIDLLLPNQDIEELLNAVNSSGGLFRFEIIVKNRYNEFHYFEVASIRTNLNGVDCIVIYGQDIHEKKLVNQRIRESEEVYRSLFNHANDAIFTLSTDLQYIDCNPTTYELFHCRRDDIIGKTPLHFSPEKQSGGFYSKDVLSMHAHKALEGATQRFEWIHLTQDGQPFITEFSLNRYLLRGTPYLQAIVRDITKQKRNQAEVFNAVVKTEERERMRIARELHDGISPLLSTVKLYSQSFVNSQNPELQKQLSQRIESTIEEAIISLSEISNKLSPHILQNFGLVEAIKTFITNVRHAKNIDIQFETNLHKRLTETIETTLYRSLTELVNNTLKHAKATIITIKLDISESILSLTYTDNGVGFNMSNHKGKGMGLFNLRNRIQSIGGNISISSQPSKGINVKITTSIEDPKDENVFIGS